MTRRPRKKASAAAEPPSDAAPIRQRAEPGDERSGMPPATAAGALSIVVDDAATGERLDRVLASAATGLTRTRVQALIRAGHVTMGGAAILDAGLRMKAGQRIDVEIPEPAPAVPRAEIRPLSVVYEDRDVIVIDKPAGLVVHPGAGHAEGTLVNALIAHCGESLSGIGGVRRPGIVHRLDKDTTGLLVAAKNDAAHLALSEQFQSHGADGRLHRAYLAVVWGAPSKPRGIVDAPLSRSEANRTKVAVVRDGAGRHAVTHFEVLERFPGPGPEPVAALLRLELETGRTHQIRVHMAHIGHPLLGDPVYGKGFLTRSAHLSEQARKALAALGRQALHAAELGFEHPVSGRRLAFESPLPEDLAGLVAALRPPSQKPVASKEAAARRDRKAPR